MAQRVLRAFTLLLAVIVPAFSAARPRPPAQFKVGMASRSFTPKEPYNWRGAKTHALQTTLWYRAAESSNEQPLDIPGFSQMFVGGSVARDASLSASPAKFPVILISHGTGGTALSVAWLGAALAKRGYIVAGVNHPGNNATEPYTVEGFSTWWERARDLSTVLDFLLADPTLSGRIDQKRIGAAGFSLGGYTMIEIAGGITEPAAFTDFCALPHADNICKSPPEFPTLVEDFQKLSKSNPEFLQHASDSYRDSRIRAAFAIAPALGPAFRPASLAKISVPVEIVAGEGDTNVPIASSAKYFAANMPGAKLVILPGNIAHYVFLDTCTDRGRQARPDLCVDGPGVDRDAVHAKVAGLAADFFAAALK
jgi:predicted dienelactone hydrolase